MAKKNFFNENGIIFNVILFDFNSGRFIPYNVIPYLIQELNKLKEAPDSFDTLKERILGISMYQWWARCQYEIILGDWPNNQVNQKIDVHYQINNNIDILTKLILNFCKNS